MKAFLILAMTVLAATAQANRECTVKDIQIAHNQVINLLRKDAAMKKNDDMGLMENMRSNKTLKITKPDFISMYSEDGVNNYYLGTIEYRNPDYNVLEGVSITGQLNANCKLVGHRLNEVSPE